jgi:hypothetical protein
MIHLNPYDMQTIRYSKCYKTFEEFIGSEEFTSMWDGWSGMRNAVEAKRRAYVEFYGAYVVPTEPKDNYGRPFDIYTHYKVAGGNKFLMKQSISACLSIHSLSPVYFGDGFFSVGSPICLNSDKSVMKELVGLGVTLF